MDLEITEAEIQWFETYTNIVRVQPSNLKKTDKGFVVLQNVLVLSKDCPNMPYKIVSVGQFFCADNNVITNMDNAPSTLGELRITNCPNLKSLSGISEVCNVSIESCPKITFPDPFIITQTFYLDKLLPVKLIGEKYHYKGKLEDFSFETLYENIKEFSKPGGVINVYFTDTLPTDIQGPILNVFFIKNIAHLWVHTIHNDAKWLQVENVINRWCGRYSKPHEHLDQIIEELIEEELDEYATYA